MKTFNQITIGTTVPQTGLYSEIIINQPNKHGSQKDASWWIIHRRCDLNDEIPSYEIIEEIPLSDKQLDTISALINIVKSLPISGLTEYKSGDTYKGFLMPLKVNICDGIDYILTINDDCNDVSFRWVCESLSDDWKVLDEISAFLHDLIPPRIFIRK